MFSLLGTLNMALVLIIFFLLVETNTLSLSGDYLKCTVMVPKGVLLCAQYASRSPNLLAIYRV